MSNKQKIIASLKNYQSSAKNQKKVYVPTLEQEINIGNLNAKHQRKLIEASLDNPVMRCLFHVNIYEILIDIVEDKEIIKKLRMEDRDAILIQLRYYFIDENYDGRSLKQTVDCIRELKTHLEVKQEIYEDNSYKIHLRIPSLVDDKIVSEYYVKSKRHDDMSKDTIRRSLGELLMVEISKYVSHITIKGDEDIEIDLDSYSIPDKLEILDNMDRKFVNIVTDFIKNAKDSYKSIYKLGKKDIQIEPQFFV